MSERAIPFLVLLFVLCCGGWALAEKTSEDCSYVHFESLERARSCYETGEFRSAKFTVHEHEGKALLVVVFWAGEPSAPDARIHTYFGSSDGGWTRYYSRHAKGGGFFSQSDETGVTIMDGRLKTEATLLWEGVPGGGVDVEDEEELCFSEYFETIKDSKECFRKLGTDGDIHFRTYKSGGKALLVITFAEATSVNSERLSIYTRDRKGGWRHYLTRSQVMGVLYARKTSEGVVFGVEDK